MTSHLKDLAPYLYKRVRLKSILHFLLGASLIFSANLPGGANTTTVDRTQLNYYFGYDLLGAIFVIIGLGIAYGLYSGTNKYHIARRWLFVAWIYAMFFFLSLVMGVLFSSPRSAPLVILWGYLTYNLWILTKDTAWAGAEIVKEIKRRDKENQRRIDEG